MTRLFRTLEGASMCKGGAQMADGRFEYTMFSDGYSAATKTYYWCTYDEPARQSVCLDDYDLNGDELIRRGGPSAAVARRLGRVGLTGPRVRLLTGAARPLE